MSQATEGEWVSFQCCTKSERELFIAGEYETFVAGCPDCRRTFTFERDAEGTWTVTDVDSCAAEEDEPVLGWWSDESAFDVEPDERVGEELFLVGTP